MSKVGKKLIKALEEALAYERGEITLSTTDAELFVKTLENPPKPNKALKKAFRRNKK